MHYTCTFIFDELYRSIFYLLQVMAKDELPEVNISNIITLSQLFPPLHLDKLEEIGQFDSPPSSSLSRIPITHGKTKFSIFRSGSVISRASTSIPELEENMLWLHDYLSDYKLELNLEYRITNVVAYSKLNLPPLNLLTLSYQLHRSSYDPTASISENERPGCDVIVYPLTDGKPRKTILIFSSSSITLTGFRSVPDLKNQAYQFQKKLKKIIEKHPEVKRNR